ncbi:MAG: hypothetical protein LBQ88_21205 [Treponema sp.]|nr:hypothetical protein [Treponema sp.]
MAIRQNTGPPKNSARQGVIQPIWHGVAPANSPFMLNEVDLPEPRSLLFTLKAAHEGD